MPLLPPEYAFDRIVAPLSVAQFLAEHHEQKVFISDRKQPDYFSDILTVDTLDDFLSSAWPVHNQVFVVNAQSEVTPEEYVLPDQRIDIVRLHQLFDEGASRRRRAADLIERSALDLPELAALWFGDVRKTHFDRMTRYLRQRMAQGQLREFPDAERTAEIVIEVVVFFARHRQRVAYEPAENQAVRDSVVRFLLAAVIPEG